MDDATTSAAIGTIDAYTLALGDATLVIVTADVDVSGEPLISVAAVDGAALAIGESLAMTDMAGLALADENSPLAGVATITSGTAIGEGAVVAKSVTSAFAAGTDTIDVAVGTVLSTAEGSTYRDAIAETALLTADEGDGDSSFIGNSSSGSISSGDFDLAHSSTTGVLVDFSDVTAAFEKQVDIDIDVSQEIDLIGNMAMLTLDAVAIGPETLVEIDSSILVTNGLSSVALSVIAIAE